jgi:hypothetical protein
MKVQEVICRVLAGTLTWLQGADNLGIHKRSLRRWRARYERDGILGLYDGRRGHPSRRKAPVAEVQRILRLYRARYGPRDGGAVFGRVRGAASGAWVSVSGIRFPPAGGQILEPDSISHGRTSPFCRNRRSIT